MDPGLIPFLLAFGVANPDWAAEVVERHAGDLEGSASKLARRRRSAELFEQLVRSDPEGIDGERRHTGPVRPQPVSRGDRIARAWADADAANDGKPSTSTATEVLGKRRV